MTNGDRRLVLSCYITYGIESLYYTVKLTFQVLGIYTFTKRANLEDFEPKQRKTQGYCTVTHFNTIHVDCHLAAVRSVILIDYVIKFSIWVFNA